MLRNIPEEHRSQFFFLIQFFGKFKFWNFQTELFYYCKQC